MSSLWCETNFNTFGPPLFAKNRLTSANIAVGRHLLCFEFAESASFTATTWQLYIIAKYNKALFQIYFEIYLQHRINYANSFKSCVFIYLSRSKNLLVKFLKLKVKRNRSENNLHKILFIKLFTHFTFESYAQFDQI